VNLRNVPLPLRPLVALASGAAFALALAGCGGSNASAGAAASDAPSAAASADASAAPDAAGGSGSATGGGSARAGGRRMMAKALASVGLSDDQKATIRSIMADVRKESAGADPATRRENYKAAFEKIQAVLTPDQQARFKAKMAELRKEQETGAQSSS
jgi:Spy/CpxP family protein refolding chaperone